MSTHHTPGPWEVEDNDSDDGLFISGPAWPSKIICHVSHEDHAISREDVANMHLIAAAPDMLAALDAVLSVADRKTDEFDKARAAIAKAVGKT